MTTRLIEARIYPHGVKPVQSAAGLEYVTPATNG